MHAERPNIMVFLWDGFDWRKLGWYGESVPRGTPTSRLDSLALRGLQLRSLEVEARRRPPHRMALVTRPHGWEVRLAEALSALGYATSWWGKRDPADSPARRAPADVGLDEAMESYFPDGDVTATPHPEEISAFDAEFRAVFDRVVTDFAIDFMGRTENEAVPLPVYIYVPNMDARTPPVSDPEYVGETRRPSERGAVVAAS